MQHGSERGSCKCVVYFNGLHEAIAVLFEDVADVPSVGFFKVVLNRDHPKCVSIERECPQYQGFAPLQSICCHRVSCCP